jgi:hypothetical protein
MNIHDVVTLAQRIHDAEGVNIGAASTRDSRNAFWARVIGCAHHGHPVYNRTPDPQWHLKRAAGRPQSDDVAVSMPSRQFWDCIPGAGADHYRFEAGHPEILPPVPDGGGVSPALATAEYWTSAHDAIRQRMAGRSVVQIAEQLAHTFPGEGWGQKRTTGGDWSPDTIGRLVDGRLWAVKVSPWTVYGFLGSGHMHRPVTAVNHLGDVPAEPPTPPPIVPPGELVPGDLVTAVDYGPRFDALAAAIAALSVEVLALGQQLDTLQTTAEALRRQEYDIDANAQYLGKVKGTIRPKP